MKNKFLKEGIILILLLVVILFTIGMLFYDFWPTKSDFEELKYIDESVLVDENLNDSYINFDNTSSEESLVKSYTIDKNSLNVYEKENSYKSGKKDPFSEVSDPVDGSIETKITEVEKENMNVANSIKSENKIEPKDTLTSSNKTQKESVNKAQKDKVSTTKDNQKENKKKTEENKQSNGFFNNHGLK